MNVCELCHISNISDWWFYLLQKELHINTFGLGPADSGTFCLRLLVRSLSCSLSLSLFCRKQLLLILHTFWSHQFRWLLINLEKLGSSKNFLLVDAVFFLVLSTISLSLYFIHEKINSTKQASANTFTKIWRNFTKLQFLFN